MRRTNLLVLISSALFTINLLSSVYLTPTNRGLSSLDIYSKPSLLDGHRASAVNVSQTSIAEWNLTLGGAKDDWAISVQQTKDGGYVIGGGTSSYGAGGSDIWLIETDLYGNVEWNKTYGDISEDGEGFGTVRQTDDGGYVFTASYSEVVGGVTVSKKFWLFKTDSVGNMLWNKTDVGTVVELTNDGGCVLAGSKWANSSFDFQLTKMNALGDIEFEKTFGGTEQEEGCSVHQTNDGGYIVAGTIGDLMFNPSGRQDLWLVKTDAVGNAEWNITYDSGGLDSVTCVQDVSDGGYVVSGYGWSSGGWAFKTDSSGSQEWVSQFGEQVWSVESTSDDGSICAGDSGGDFLLTKLDSSGNPEWSETFGGTAPDSAYSVQQTTDGGYIVVGYTDSFGAGNRDGWVLKLTGEQPPAEIWVPDDYARIEWAIGNASDGNTIRVRAGTYYEHLTVDKALKILGEDPATTVIDGNDTGTNIVHVTANDNVFSGFTIQNSGLAPTPAIRFDGSNNVIDNCEITQNGWGIYAFGVSNNTIKNSLIVNNVYGIELEWVTNHTIRNNTISNHQEAGIYLRESNNNLISANLVTNNKDAIVLVSNSNNNKFYHNNFIDNASPGFAVSSDTNTWDDGYPSGGNYWSDYVGTDANHDGIGDTPYVIDGNNTDNYPLMTPYIISEFPSFLILSLFMIATLLAVKVHKRKRPKSSRE